MGRKAPSDSTFSVPLAGSFASPLQLLLLSFLTLPVGVLGLRASTMRASIATTHPMPVLLHRTAS